MILKYERIILLVTVYEYDLVSSPDMHVCSVALTQKHTQ